MPTRAKQSVDVDLMDGLVQTSFKVIESLSRAAAEHDLSLTQLRVLAILRDHQPTMADLATHLGLERSSVSGLIDRAVKRGLVRRHPSDDDGRVIRVTFTPEGNRLAKVMTAQVGGLIASITDPLSPAERTRLTRLLEKLIEPR